MGILCAQIMRFLAAALYPQGIFVFMCVFEKRGIFVFMCVFEKCMCVLERDCVCAHVHT